MISTPYGLPVSSPLSPRLSARGISPAALIGSRVASPRPSSFGGAAYFAGSGLQNLAASGIAGGGLPIGTAIPISTGVSTGITNTAVGATGPIRGQSRMEYIPYERKYMDYEAREYVDKVPVQRTVIDYKEVKRIEYVPKERVVTDYYAIEYQTHYVPQTIPQKKIEYVPVETVTERVEYFPVQKQVVHYPDELSLSRRNLIGLVQGPTVASSTMPGMPRSSFYPGVATSSLPISTMGVTSVGSYSMPGTIISGPQPVIVSDQVITSNSSQQQMQGGYTAMYNNRINSTDNNTIIAGATLSRPTSNISSDRYTYQVHPPRENMEGQAMGGIQRIGLANGTTEMRQTQKTTTSKLANGIYGTEHRDQYVPDRTGGIKVTMSKYDQTVNRRQS